MTGEVLFSRSPQELDIKIPDLAIGIYRPQTVITNEEVQGWGLRTAHGMPVTPQFIQEKLGIERRYVAGEGETVVSMAAAALREALEIARPDGIDILQFSASHAPGQFLAGVLEREIGLAVPEKFDVYAACSGLVRGLTCLAKREAMGLLKVGDWVAMVASEQYHPTLYDLRDPEQFRQDPSMSQLIFSDGAAAWVFRWGVDLVVEDYRNFRFPSQYQSLIRMPVGVPRHPHYIEEAVPFAPKFVMDGPGVYRAVMKFLPSLVNELAGQARPLVVLHQASGKVLDGLGERLDQYGLSLYRDLAEGNFSSVSIPKAMARAVAEGSVKKGDTVVLAGFGAGMFASVARVRFPE